MLSEAVVTIFLEASITGAGLVLAVYALITPISEKIFKDRAKMLEGLIEQFDKEKSKITVDAPNKDFKRFNQLRAEIKQVRVVPSYWAIGILSTFLLFMVSAFGDTSWLVISADRTSVNEFLIVTFFMLGIILFTFIGGYTIGEILTTMTKEFEDIKKKQKEAKEASVNLSAYVTVRGEAEVKEKKHEPQNNI